MVPGFLDQCSGTYSRTQNRNVIARSGARLEKDIHSHCFRSSKKYFFFPHILYLCTADESRCQRRVSHRWWIWQTRVGEGTCQISECICQAMKMMYVPHTLTHSHSLSIYILQNVHPSYLKMARCTLRVFNTILHQERDDWCKLSANIFYFFRLLGIVRWIKLLKFMGLEN